MVAVLSSCADEEAVTGLNRRGDRLLLAVSLSGSQYGGLRDVAVAQASGTRKLVAHAGSGGRIVRMANGGPRPEVIQGTPAEATPAAVVSVRDVARHYKGTPCRRLIRRRLQTRAP